MALEARTRLGPYEVVGPIGKGGMGEVYRARDTKLDRDVAIKVLPDELAGDEARVARFEREAKLLASLNHPNIASIYGFEQNALILELVEGPTLAERVEQGPVPVDEAIPIAKQIAEALEAGHAAGVIHRDLKPANIKLQKDGTVKVLDYGLAKALEDEHPGSDDSDLSRSPTLTRQGTQIGVILGTAAYMSPEQAKGRPVDKRTDIWAFGVVLYEMLTGQRLFDGETVSDIIAAVLRDPVDFSRVPEPARSAVEACLRRDPKQRLRDAGDVALLFDLHGSDHVAPPAPPATAGPAGWLWPALAAGAAAAALVLAVLVVGQTTPAATESREMVTFEIPGSGQAPTVTAISPDGRHVLYAVIPEGAPSQLWVRSFGSLEGRPLPGSEGVAVQAGTVGGAEVGLNPVAAWSHDSQEVVFAVAGSLRRIDIATGQVTVLAERSDQEDEGFPTTTVGPGAWSGNGTILQGTFSFDIANSGIWSFPEIGGTPTQVTRLAGDETTHRPSSFLPDGRSFLYLVNHTGDERSGDVRVGSLDRPPSEQDTMVLLRADAPAVYAPAVGGSSGHVLFVRRGILMAQAFHPESGTLEGEPEQLATGVGLSFSVSSGGRLVYRSAGAASGSLSSLVRFDRSGLEIGRVGSPASYVGVGRFADGRRLVVTRADPGQAPHTYIVDIDRAAFTRLNTEPGYDSGEVVSRGDLVAYTHAPEGVARDIYVRAANGVGEPRLLRSSDIVKHPNDWSPDGRFLLYDEHVPGRGQDMLLVDGDGGDPVPFLTTEADETHGQFSPDGRWIAYRSTESGRSEVYVRDFEPDRTPAYGSERVQISVDGGDAPRFGPDGREIFFLGPAGTLFAAPVSLGPPFAVGTPEELFPTQSVSFFRYVVMPDGTFIVNTATELPPEATPPLVVMLNWQSALRRQGARLP